MGMLGGGAIDCWGVCVGVGWNAGGGAGAGLGLAPTVAASMRWRDINIGTHEHSDMGTYVENAWINNLIEQQRLEKRISKLRMCDQQSHCLFGMGYHKSLGTLLQTSPIYEAMRDAPSSVPKLL